MSTLADVNYISLDKEAIFFWKLDLRVSTTSSIGGASIVFSPFFEFVIRMSHENFSVVDFLLIIKFCGCAIFCYSDLT